jgi:plastocyanin
VVRRAVLASGLATLLLAWPGVSALAADPVVHASSDQGDVFTPGSVTVNVGGTVHWTNDGGTHNVVADDGSFKLGGDPVTHSPADTPWNAQFTFNKVGTFRYYCQEHGDRGGIGMSGKVVVKDPSDKTPPKISGLKAQPAKFCTNKSESCKKRGTAIKFTLSEAATVRGTIKPAGSKKAGTEAFKTKLLKKGARTVNYSGKGLKPGKYSLTLVATDANKNKSKPATVGVTVKKNG